MLKYNLLHGLKSHVVLGEMVETYRSIIPVNHPNSILLGAKVQNLKLCRILSLTGKMLYQYRADVSMHDVGDKLEVEGGRR